MFTGMALHIKTFLEKIESNPRAAAEVARETERADEEDKVMKLWSLKNDSLP
jgi:hypothetical protein